MKYKKEGNNDNMYANENERLSTLTIQWDKCLVSPFGIQIAVP